LNILSAEKLSKAYSDKVLFREASVSIDDDDRIGVIGINGTGKSTLLKIIAGDEPPDSGKLTTASKLTIEYLSQNPSFDTEMTILQQIFKGTSPIMDLLREYEHTLQEFNANPGNALWEKRLLQATQKMDVMKAWTIESEAKTILTKLGIQDFEAKIGSLSGGQRKRIALASALISPAQLLILDEPTNQLDNDTVDWLEKYLNSRKGALLMVTHDRYFLRRVCNRIVEIDDGKIYSYQTNYEKYLELKAEREESDIASERKRQSLYRKELEWMSRGPQARATKQKARIERFETLRDTKSPESYENIDIQVGTTRLGKKTIELEHIGKDYSNRRIIDNFSYNVVRDDRIGIIGPNGSGKSTLLKIISGRLKPDRGGVDTGETVKIGFFTQENDEIDESLRVIEYIRNEAEYLTTEDGQISAAQMLENFLFPPSTQWSLISKLSGGEKRRLYLLRILMSAPNILLLDEPTNDLDIQTLTILESYLNEFQGAVVAVSHDRYFLDRVVDKLFVFDGNASIQRFQGCYSDYETKKTEVLAASKDDSIRAKTGKTDSGSKAGKPDYNTENGKNRPLKFTYKEQKEYDSIDGAIATLETHLVNVAHDIDLASSDFEKLQKLFALKETLETRLNETTERWVYLNELSELIAANSKDAKEKE